MLLGKKIGLYSAYDLLWTCVKITNVHHFKLIISGEFFIDYQLLFLAFTGRKDQLLIRLIWE